MTQNDTPAGRRNLVPAGGTLLIWIPSLAGPALCDRCAIALFYAKRWHIDRFWRRRDRTLAATSPGRPPFPAAHPGLDSRGGQALVAGPDNLVRKRLEHGQLIAGQRDVQG